MSERKGEETEKFRKSAVGRRASYGEKDAKVYPLKSNFIQT